MIENNNLKEEIKRIKASVDDAVSDTDEDYVSPVNHGLNSTVAENSLNGSLSI